MRLIWLFVLVFTVILMPTSANAGVFSFIGELFADKAEAEQTAPQNSQNMPVLQAVAHEDPNPTKGGPDFSIVEGSALESAMGPSGAVAEIADKASSDQISVYIVREGDTLSSVAEMFDVSQNTIIWANNITGKTLKKDQMLVILPISGIKYVVKKGDTLKSIATKYKSDADEIADFNDLGSGVLVAGTEIIIPDGEIGATVAPKPASIAAKSTVSSGYYIRPIAGGKRTQGIHGRNGVDLASKVGTPVYASAGGTVIVSMTSGWNGGYGNYVVISHPNGTQTLYAHLSANSVSVGSKVSQGDQIGLMGSTGRSTGPHVHFEIRGSGAPRNPF